MRLISKILTSLIVCSSFLANASETKYDNSGLYEADFTTYNWIEATEQANATDIRLSDDDTSVENIAFPFSFYEEEYNHLTISSNGFITFADDPDDGCCSGNSIPEEGGETDNYIAAWHGDLDPSSGGFITAATYGTAPNRIFIVQFDDIRTCCDSDNPQVSFQYQLHENNNSIEVHYKSFEAYGNTITLGIENTDGTDGIEFYHGDDEDFVDSYPDGLIAIKYAGPRVDVSYNSTQTSEVLNSITIDVVLTEAPTADVVIPVMSDNTLEGTVDVNSLTFTSTNWETPQTITVTGVDDEVLDGDISYNVILGASSSDDVDFSGFDKSIPLVNVDNETPGVFIADLSSATLREGESVQFMVALNTLPTDDVTFVMPSELSLYAMRFEMTPASVIFTSENGTTPQLVTITYPEDLTALPDDNITLDFFASSLDANYNLNSSIELSVIDNDIADIIVETTGNMTSESGDSVELTISLATAPVGDIDIHVDTIQAFPYGLIEGYVSTILTFDASNWDQPQTVVVTGNDNSDLTPTEDQNYSIGIQGESLEQGDALYGSPALNKAIELTHDDDDVIEVVLSNLEAMLVNEDGTATTVDLSLNNLPTADVTVVVTSSNEDELTVSTASYLFTVDNWDALQSLELVGVNDDIDDGNQTVVVTVTTTSTDDNYNNLTKSFSVVNADNDTASIVLDVTEAFTTSELGGKQVLNFMLSTQPSADVSFELYSTDTTEGQLSSSLITFTADNWNVAQAVTVSGQVDLVNDGDVNYKILFQPSSSEDELYNALTLATLSATNIDDVADYSISVSLTSLSVSEEQTVSFDVVLTAQPSADVILPLFSSNTNEATLSSESLTFTADNWNTPQTITVSGVSDGAVDAAQATYILFLPAISDDTHYDAFFVESISVLVDNTTQEVIVEDVVVEDVAEDVAELVETKKSSGGSINFFVLLCLLMVKLSTRYTKK